MSNKDETEHVSVSSLVKEYIEQNKSYLVMYIICLIGVPLKEILIPHLFGKITVSFQNNEPLLSKIIFVLVIFLIAYILSLIIDWEDIYYYPKMMDFFRNKIMSSLYDHYRENYEDIKTSEVVVKIIKLPLLIHNYLNLWKLHFIPVLFTFFIVCIYMLYTDITLGLISLVTLMLFTMILILAPKQCMYISSQRDLAWNNINEEIDDSLRNIVATLNTNNESYELAKISELNDEYSKSATASMQCIFYRQSNMMFVQTLFISTSLWRCWYLLKSNKIDTGKIVSLILILLFVLNSLKLATFQLKSLITKTGSIKETMQIFNKLGEKSSTDVCEEQDAKKHQIFIENVSYKYPGTNNKYALQSANIVIEKGEKIIIVGRIGSGKSTLLKLITKYKKPTSGCIYIDGVNYMDIPTKELRKKISYIPQMPSLFNRTIYENIIYGLEDSYTLEEIDEFMIAFKLNDIFKDGLLISAGKNGNNLSGGQKQIIWFIRTVLQSPEILLLDEPTASMDEYTKKHIYTLLDILADKCTIIMVSHDENLVKTATRVITISHETSPTQ